MPMDSEVIDAIQEAVSDSNQPKTVADRILKWFEQRVDSEMTPADEIRQLDLVRKAINVANGDEA
jgi:hypothetical protein